MQISQNGLNLIKSFEGCLLKAYKPNPAEQLYTIGWGHYGVQAGTVWTQAQADAALLTDIKQYENGVNNLVKVAINQNQFDALVSFAYNCGVGTLTSSTLLKLVNAGNFQGASLEFGNWIHGANRSVMPGLVRRREAERQLFVKPASAPTPVLAPAPAPAPTSAPAPIVSGLPLKVGSTGDMVKFVQRFLGIAADGIFGNQTQQAVIKYQKMKGLSVDGIVGQQTWGAMQS